MKWNLNKSIAQLFAGILVLTTGAFALADPIDDLPQARRQSRQRSVIYESRSGDESRNESRHRSCGTV